MVGFKCGRCGTVEQYQSVEQVEQFASQEGSLYYCSCGNYYSMQEVLQNLFYVLEKTQKKSLTNLEVMAQRLADEEKKASMAIGKEKLYLKPLATWTGYNLKFTSPVEKDIPF